jgi:hypothetical protein
VDSAFSLERLGTVFSKGDRVGDRIQWSLDGNGPRLCPCRKSRLLSLVPAHLLSVSFDGRVYRLVDSLFSDSFANARKIWDYEAKYSRILKLIPHRTGKRTPDADHSVLHLATVARNLSSNEVRACCNSPSNLATSSATLGTS